MTIVAHADRGRLAKAIRLRGSDQPGECENALAAMGRLLQDAELRGQAADLVEHGEVPARNGLLARLAGARLQAGLVYASVMPPGGSKVVRSVLARLATEVVPMAEIEHAIAIADEAVRMRPGR